MASPNMAPGPVTPSIKSPNWVNSEGYDDFNEQSQTTVWFRMKNAEKQGYIQRLESEGKRPHINHLENTEKRIIDIRRRFEQDEQKSELKTLRTSFQQCRDHASKQKAILIDVKIPREQSVFHLINEDEHVPSEHVPEKEFKIGFIHFEQTGFGWKGTTNKEKPFTKPTKFPDQKIPISKVFDPEEANLFRPSLDSQGRRHLRYVHRPANHMEWVEVSLGDAPRFPANRTYLPVPILTRNTLRRKPWQGITRRTGWPTNNRQ